MFFINGASTTEIYTLSLHDALPICVKSVDGVVPDQQRQDAEAHHQESDEHSGASDFDAANVERLVRIRDRKSTRLNSSHRCISYAVFCLKKKTEKQVIAIALDTLTR